MSAVAVGAEAMQTVSLTSDVKGLRTRRPTPGPETELVEHFLQVLSAGCRRSKRVSVFREPALPSGFPDLVEVAWDGDVAGAWKPERADLSVDDLRAVHLLATSGPMTLPELRKFSGMLPRRLDFLEDVGVAIRRGGRWTAAPLCRCFAVREIVAFEAKIADWSKALDQAWANTWFASRSYIVLPKSPTPAALDAASARGIGVWVAGNARPTVLAKRSPYRQPLSFASWLLNDWAWKAATSSRGRA